MPRTPVSSVGLTKIRSDLSKETGVLNRLLGTRAIASGKVPLFETAIVLNVLPIIGTPDLTSRAPTLVITPN
jgi:hypothetical protein